MSEPPRVSGRVLHTRSKSRLKAGLKTRRNAAREGGFTPALLFPGTMGHGTKPRPTCPTLFSTAGQPDTTVRKLFAAVTAISTSRNGFPQNRLSQMRGTAGQEDLTLLDTIIKCPTKLSHFRDQWDKHGKSYAFRRDPTRSVSNSRPHRSTGFTPEGVTLTFFLGQWDTGQDRDARKIQMPSQAKLVTPTRSGVLSPHERSTKGRRRSGADHLIQPGHRR
jgi:hypothetical protein